MYRYIIIFILFLLCPLYVFAQESIDYVEEIKYYKTSVFSDNNLYSLKNQAFTEEVTKEEYENANESFNISLLDFQNGYVETTYKKMTTSISKNGTGYRYKVVLNWKNIPSTRSYDIIGIGFLSNVKVKSLPSFSQEYCYSNGTCMSESSYISYKGANGASAVFKLPNSSIQSLSQIFYIDVEKNITSNILKQYAYGDYSHATKSISEVNAKNHIVNTSGIVLDSSIKDYYDNINVATAKWTGTW